MRSTDRDGACSASRKTSRMITPFVRALFAARLATMLLPSRSSCPSSGRASRGGSGIMPRPTVANAFSCAITNASGRSDDVVRAGPPVPSADARETRRLPVIAQLDQHGRRHARRLKMNDDFSVVGGVNRRLNRSSGEFPQNPRRFFLRFRARLQAGRPRGLHGRSLPIPPARLGSQVAAGCAGSSRPCQDVLSADAGSRWREERKLLIQTAAGSTPVRNGFSSFVSERRRCRRGRQRSRGSRRPEMDRATHARGPAAARTGLSPGSRSSAERPSSVSPVQSDRPIRHVVQPGDCLLQTAERLRVPTPNI